MSIWQHAERFSEVPSRYQMSLGEGNTPLIRSRRIGPRAGLDQLYFKLETGNPTGSFKDRFAAAAISDMLARRKSRCVATSSGNTGSALAAYCAASGIQCQIAVVETAPAGKLSQMLAYGAQLYRVRGMGTNPEITERAFATVSRMAEAPDAALQITAFCYSPAGMRGVKTISYELIEQCEGPIDHVFCPAGGGGLTLAVALGFGDLLASSHVTVSPKIHCVQPDGNDTMAGPLRAGALQAHAVDCTSQISGLQVPSVADGNQVIRACRASGGTGHTVSDEMVWDVQARLMREEGVFCEPAGAVALAGALRAAAVNEIHRHESLVCLITGVAFKDPLSIDRLVANCACPLVELYELEQSMG